MTIARSSRCRPRCMIAALTVLFLLPVASAMATNEVEQIDQLVRAYHGLGKFNGSAIVTKGGEVIYRQGVGFANMEWEIPNAPDTKFRLGSITKQFTGALILQLVEEGVIALDDPLSRHVPEYPSKVGDSVTIHHLLTHTSGIASYTGLPNFFAEYSRDAYTPEAFLDVFKDLPLEFEPGSTWRYNNSGYFLLGVIVENVTGKPYAEALRERILEPLGMHDTGYDTHDEILEKRAAGYEQRGAGYRNAPYLDMSLPYAAGSMYSTVEDMLLWDRALYTTRILTPHYRDMLWHPHVEVAPGADRHYGYGFMTGQRQVGESGRTVTSVEHGGGINGFNTLIVRVPEDQHLVVLLNNTGRTELGSMAKGILNILYGYEADPPRQQISRVVMTTIGEHGVEAAIDEYRRLRETSPRDYEFAESELNDVGYELLRRGDAKG
ncbi:MAG: serine hydrolase domain-containing protein, partial [Planctomycetota bacterium]